VKLRRPDLKRKIAAGGLLFTVFYFLFFLGVSLFWSGFIKAWNFSAILGIIVVGVPLEKLIFAFAFGDDVVKRL